MQLSAEAKKTLSLGVCYGAALWGFSLPLFGSPQPWDGRLSVYLLLLFLGGGVLGYYGRVSAWLVFAALYCGQVLPLSYHAYAGSVPYYRFSLALLLVFSLPAVLGAFAGGKVAAFAAPAKEPEKAAE